MTWLLALLGFWFAELAWFVTSYLRSASRRRDLLSLCFLPILPGQSWTNGDGVQVRVNPCATGGAMCSPMLGSPSSKTRVQCFYGFRGRIDDLDQTDRVSVESNVRVRIDGCPERVTLAAGCAALIVNRGELVSFPGGAPFIVGPDVTVWLPQGGVATVPAGTSQLFTP